MLTDPIADMLTRIRNGGTARMRRVPIPQSKLKLEIARVLKERGFIRDYATGEDEKKPVFVVELRYDPRNRPMIERLERVSRPGRRVHLRSSEIPQVRSGLGLAIVSTNRGIMSGEQAREEHVGGEYLARVW